MQKAGLLGTLVDSGLIASWTLLVLFFKVPTLGPLADLSSLGVLAGEQWLWPEWGEAVCV